MDVSERKKFATDLERYWVEYCLSKLGAQCSFPFGDDAMVFKVANKVFGLMLHRNGNLAINLKCDPDHAVELRDLFTAVTPGYHMNKKHWNTVYFDGTLPDGELKRQIDHSYDLIVNALPKAKRAALSKAI